MDMHLPLPSCPPTPLIRPVHIPTPQALQAIRQYIFGNQDVTHHTTDMRLPTPPPSPIRLAAYITAPQAVTQISSSSQYELLDHQLENPRRVRVPETRGVKAFLKKKREWQSKSSHLRHEIQTTDTKPSRNSSLWKRLFERKQKWRKKLFRNNDEMRKGKGSSVTPPMGAPRQPVVGSLPTKVQPPIYCTFKPLQRRSPHEHGQFVKRKRARDSYRVLDAARMRLEEESGIKIEKPERALYLVGTQGYKGSNRRGDTCGGGQFSDEAGQYKSAVSEGRAGGKQGQNVLPKNRGELLKAIFWS
jgi:hypothetical protein